MNRAIRRRQEKSQKPPRRSLLPPEFQRLFSEAVGHHQARRFSQAEQLYARILDFDPTHADALHLLGLTAYQQGDYGKALDLITRAIAQDRGKPHYSFNLGLVLEKLNRPEEAESAYSRAVQLNPAYVEAATNLGNVLRAQGKLDQAVHVLRGVVEKQPRSAEAHNNLGVTLKEQGRLQEAVREYRSALEVNPKHAEAWNNLGVALKEDGHLEEAKTAFQEALSHRPGYAHAHYHLGLVSLWQRDTAQALACFRRSAEITYDHHQPVAIPTVAKARIKHDYEQIQYLLSRSLVSDLPDAYVDTLSTLYRRIHTEPDSSWFLRLSSQEQSRLAPSFNRLIYIAEAQSLPQGALNPDLQTDDIEARYFQSQPESMYVDNLLNPDALACLRAFCLESTIWKRDYRNGYIGTFLANGFACPLLLQIAEELRTRFPRIFQDHQLAQAWAFKHDSALRGLNMHADAAAVNVNFWITPNEASQDSESGGLIVWDKEAPDEWDFREYNSEAKTPEIRDYLRQQQAKAITIPHRQNRAVIFNSNLFHETDKLVFKDTYEDRRINVTLLYGSRQKARQRPT